jgi:hypothetical protein
MRKILCPKCRTLGLTHDCSDTLLVSSDDEYELEVTLTFSVPVTSTLAMGPHEMATHYRETWLSEDPDQLKNVLIDVVDDDYDLQVKPVFVA